MSEHGLAKTAIQNMTGILMPQLTSEMRDYELFPLGQGIKLIAQM
jgi:hypothetical protein